MHSLQPRGLNLLPNFQKGAGALEGFNFERGIAAKEGVAFFRGLQFYKKKLKKNLTYLMKKKVYKQKYFSLS